MLYFLTDGCINKSLTYLLTYYTSGQFTVTRTSTNTSNSVVIKNLVKIVKYREFLANVYTTVAGNVVGYIAVYVKISFHGQSIEQLNIASLSHPTVFLQINK